MFFVKTQRTPTQTDTKILSVYSLSLESERFVHFFERERQSDSPRKTSTLRCQMQAQRPIFYIDCRKIYFCSTLSEFKNFLLCEGILINVTTCQNETSS
jgi:hypothetical protein